MLHLGRHVSEKFFYQLEKLAIKFHFLLVNRSFRGPTYNDYRVMEEHLQTSKKKNLLTKMLQFRQIEYIPAEPSLRLDFVDKIDKTFLSSINDTRNLRNIQLFYNEKQYDFRSFYKQVIRKQCRDLTCLKHVTKNTSMRICAHTDEKVGSVVCFSAFVLYFCYQLGIGSNKPGEVDFYLKIAAYLARIALLGQPDDFLKSFAQYDYNIDELSEHGVLKSSILRHYMYASEGMSKLGYREGRFGLTKENKTARQPFSDIPFNEAPDSGSFIIRTENVIVMLRSVGFNNFHKKEYSYIQIPVDQESDKLHFQTYADYRY